MSAPELPLSSESGEGAKVERWHVDSAGNIRSEAGSCPNGLHNACVVAEVMWYGPTEGHPESLRQERPRLIAAAPELLAALKSCREAFLALPDGWAEALPANVTPAIIKAEGK